MQKKKCGRSWIYTEERLKWARSIAIGGAIKEMCFVFKVYIKELEIDLGRATIHKLQFYTLDFFFSGRVICERAKFNVPGRKTAKVKVIAMYSILHIHKGYRFVR